MQRRWITVALLLGLVGGIALSQGAKVGGEARQLAMGGSSALSGIAVNPFITQDPIFILINPAYQISYGSYAWWNIGGGTLNGLSSGDNGYNKQNFGVSFNLSRDLVIGTVFSYDPSAVNVVSTTLAGGAAAPGVPFTLPGFIPGGLARGGGVTGAQAIPPVQNVWEALAAFRTGGLDLGFGFMYGTSNSTTKSSAGAASSEREASSRMIGLRGGLLLDFGGGSNLDAHAAFRMDKATDAVKFSPAANGQGGEYSASGTELEVGGRIRLRMSNRFNFVPYAAFTTVSGEPKEDAPRLGVTATTASYKFSTTALAVGAGGEYKVSSVYLAGGLSFQMLRGKVELSSGGTTPTSSTTTVTYTSVPTVNFGAEWWLTDWLAARGGYFRMLGSLNTKGETSTGGTGSTGETTVSTPLSIVGVGGLGPANWDGVVTLGIGLRFGNFSLDGTVSDEAIRRGFGVIGSSDNINTFGYLTASYNFE